MLEEILGPRRMGDRRHQSVGDSENLLMRLLAAGSAVQHNILARIEDICDLIEIRIVRSRDRLGDVHRIGVVVIHGRGEDARATSGICSQTRHQDAPDYHRGNHHGSGHARSVEQIGGCRLP